MVWTALSLSWYNGQTWQRLQRLNQINNLLFESHKDADLSLFLPWELGHTLKTRRSLLKLSDANQRELRLTPSAPRKQPSGDTTRLRTTPTEAARKGFASAYNAPRWMSSWGRETATAGIRRWMPFLPVGVTESEQGCTALLIVYMSWHGPWLGAGGREGLSLDSVGPCLWITQQQALIWTFMLCICCGYLRWSTSGHLSTLSSISFVFSFVCFLCVAFDS